MSVAGGHAWVGTDEPRIPADGEGPARKTRVEPFRIDPLAVTNAWFAEFVSATGWRTDAERFGWSMVFHAFAPPVERPRHVAGAEWWMMVDGADWAHPEGPGSSLDGRGTHPVVHVSWNDAVAFARWAGGRLPTEAEWECAARGGLARATFPWGEREPDDTAFLPCNIWQGRFPRENSAADGFAGAAPVDAFAPNGYGLFNMVGNVWEWSSDAFRVRSVKAAARALNKASAAENRRLLKGGSYLCHRSYCHRYRIAARTGVSADSSTGHMGFRLAFD